MTQGPKFDSRTHNAPVSVVPFPHGVMLTTWPAQRYFKWCGMARDWPEAVAMASTELLQVHKLTVWDWCEWPMLEHDVQAARQPNGKLEELKP